MFRTFAIALSLALLTGCAIVQPLPEPAADTSAIEVSVDNPVAAPEPLSAAEIAPDVCELLLDSLELAQPLLSDLEGKLSRHASQVDAAVAKLAPPAQKPQQKCPQPQPSTASSKDVIGGLEWIYMEPPGRHYRARVDSGAETSSLSASDIVEFERDGDNWVKFTFQHDKPEEGKAQQAIEIELPIVRTVLIRQAGVAQVERRVSVQLSIRLGKQLQSTEFTLADRSKMTYPVLLGRAFLMDLYLVDVARTYVHRKYKAP